MKTRINTGNVCRQVGHFCGTWCQGSGMIENCSFNDKITLRHRNGVAFQFQDFNIDKRMFVLYDLIIKEQMFSRRVYDYIIL